MRTTAEGWAAYVVAAREHSGMTRPELARAIGVQSSTVYRWEKSGVRPEQAGVVARLADVLGLDLNEALAAAGLRPTTEPPPAQPTRQDPPMDKDALYLMRRLADPDVSPEEKAFIRATLQRAARLLMEQEEAEAELRELERRRAAG